MQHEPAAQVAVAPPVKPIMLDVADVKEMPAEQPGPPTVFVFRNGERVEARRYTMTQNTLRLGDEGQERNVALAMLDRDATVAANQAARHSTAVPYRFQPHGVELLACA